MIVVKTQGGLCNQIFQWAYGYSLSKDCGKKLFIDDSFFRGGCMGCTPREFQLHKFKKINLHLFEGDVIQNFFTSPVFKIVDHHTYQDIDCSSINGNILLDGYWQSEIYFKKYRKDIVSIIGANKSDYSQYDFKNSCSLHVRRTDYLNLPDYHFNLTESYYEKALEIINPKGYVYIFSDDIQWCKNTFKINNAIFMENNSPIEDLHLMSLCSNNIIANSSFSWWGAWLNKNPRKKVIAPSVWFGPDGPLTKNILPSKWIKIDPK